MNQALILNLAILIAAGLGMWITGNPLLLAFGLLILKEMPYGLLAPKDCEDCEDCEDEEKESAIGFHVQN